MDGIAGIGNGYGVGIVQQGEAEVRDALLGADGDDGLGLGVDLDVVARLIPVGDGATQARNSAGERVAVSLSLLCGLDQLIDDCLGGSSVRIPHPEVDDVFAAFACRCLQLAGYVEHICREPGQSSELFHCLSRLPLD